MFGRKLILEFTEFLAEDEGRHLLVHIVEDHRTRQTVDEFWLEGFLHLFQHSLATRDLTRKADIGLGSKLRPSIRSHDEDHVAEVGLAPLVIRQTGIVHHLQQNVIDVLMRLFNLVEQEYAVRRLADGICQQTSILIAHITRRRADELRNGMLLCVFAHIEA